MTRLFLILLVFLNLTALTSLTAQTVNLDDWKIKSLKIHTITETSIFHLDSIKPDTFPIYKAFYDTTGKIIEKRYDYRRVSLISNELKYTSAIYKYDKNGNLIETKIVDPWTPVLFDSFYSPRTECKYFDTAGNLLKIELTRENRAKETTIYTYKEFTIKDNSNDWTTKLPMQIDNYYKEHLEEKKIIEYDFY
jgi:hypothetical protein